MQRILEPELMTDEEQARAYAAVDWESTHSIYPKVFAAEFASLPEEATVLDLGCGTADITIRFARAFPQFRFDALDGSPAMLTCAAAALQRHPDVASRIHLIEGMLPGAPLPQKEYDVIISNSLLHHLPDPQALWQAVQRGGVTGTRVFVTDLFRPASLATAKALVDQYATGEPDIFRRDFLNSLLAAFSPGEVQAQLTTAGLESLKVKVMSDRHLLVAGRLG